MAATGHERRIGDVSDVSGVPPIASRYWAAPPKHRAMCGRLRVGKSFLYVSSSGRGSHVFGLLARFT